MACYDLTAHHGEPRGGARINNSCPRCQWFDPDINNWPRWDGRVDNNPTTDSTPRDMLVSQSTANDEALALALQFEGS